jgi:hypothetical protein
MNVRSLHTPDDDRAVRRIFRATIVLGRRLPFDSRTLDRYEALCLDWYLGTGRADAAVLEDDEGTIAGYALVCTDEDGYQHWNTRRAARFAVRSLPQACARNPFVRLRMRDGWALWRARQDAPMPAHAHMNLAPTVRAGRAGHLLGDHIDDRVRRAGLPGWYGEINAPAGRRAAALERLGGEVVHRSPNRTLSAFANQPIERLTVVRRLPQPDASDFNAA